MSLQELAADTRASSQTTTMVSKQNKPDGKGVAKSVKPSAGKKLTFDEELEKYGLNDDNGDTTPDGDDMPSTIPPKSKKKPTKKPAEKPAKKPAKKPARRAHTPSSFIDDDEYEEDEEPPVKLPKKPTKTEKSQVRAKATSPKAQKQPAKPSGRTSNGKTGKLGKQRRASKTPRVEDPRAYKGTAKPTGSGKAERKKPVRRPAPVAPAPAPASNKRKSEEPEDTNARKSPRLEKKPPVDYREMMGLPPIDLSKIGNGRLLKTGKDAKKAPNTDNASTPTEPASPVQREDRPPAANDPPARQNDRAGGDRGQERDSRGGALERESRRLKTKQ